jgi:hypothetical protein
VLKLCLRWLALACLVRCCKHAPKAILYYRDGVADSQFESVITKELVAIRDAIRQLRKDHPDWWKVSEQDSS